MTSPRLSRRRFPLLPAAVQVRLLVALLVTPLVPLLLLVSTATARAATEYPDSYGCQTTHGRCDDGRYPIQYVSLFDRQDDHYFLRFPDGYDKQKSYPLFVHFHAYCAGDSSIGDPRMHRQVANDNQVIFVGHWQRGGEMGSSECGASYLGDGKQESPAAAAAAKQDMKELLNEVAARFKINYVIAAGSSMGGYVALRMPTVIPDKVYVALATVPALVRNHNIFPEPSFILDAARTGVYDDRFCYDVVGTGDDFITVNRELNGLMRGKRYWSYHEVAGAGHENFFADDWNLGHHYCTDPNRSDSHCWYVSTPDTPNLWEGIRAWESEHQAIAGGLLEPDCDWQAPARMADWYITQDLYDQGGRPWPHPNPKCSGGDGGPPPPPDAGRRDTLCCPDAITPPDHPPMPIDAGPADSGAADAGAADRPAPPADAPRADAFCCPPDAPPLRPDASLADGSPSPDARSDRAEPLSDRSLPKETRGDLACVQCPPPPSGTGCSCRLGAARVPVPAVVPLCCLSMLALGLGTARAACRRQKRK